MEKTILRRLVGVLLAILAVSTLSGCAGTARATHWTDLVVQPESVLIADLQQVSALDRETGQLLWSFPPEAVREYGPFYTLVLDDSSVLFATSSERSGSGLFAQPARGVLRALDIETRQVLWEFDDVDGDFNAPGAYADGLLVIGNGDGNVYALNGDNGTRVWTFATEERVWASPLVLSDTVYIAGLDHSLYAIDLLTGQERWRFAAEGAMVSRPLVWDGLLFVGAFDHNLYALDPLSGREVWRFEGQNWFWGTPTTDGSRLYVADVGGNVYALDVATGSQVWTVLLEQPVHLPSVLSEDGALLLVAGADRNNAALYGLDTADGFVLWEQAGSGQLAALAVDGAMAYVTRILGEERAQALYVETGRLLWSYPQPETAQ